MNSIVERMEKEFDNFMKHYREMDADEFIKELEEAGVSFVPCDYESIGNMTLKGIEANNNNRIQISRTIPLCA